MICRLMFAGFCEVPRPWYTALCEGVNRLYYIHGGTGGYRADGYHKQFMTGMLYLLPFFSKVIPYTDEHDRLVHTYANFELIPPIISREPLVLDPKESPETEAVLNTFLVLSKKAAGKMLAGEEGRMLTASIEYLVSRAIAASGTSLLDDPTLNKALGIMNDRMRDGLGIADIAKECYMSTDGFIRKFTRVVGSTPYAYYKRLKLRTALAMRESGYTLEAAAEACGYSDASALLHAIAKEKTK